MPSRPVIEHICERCTRSWYVGVDEKTPPTKVKLSFSSPKNELIEANYECLCEGCSTTVQALVESIAKIMKKSAPVRGAKKKAGDEGKPSTPTSTTTAPQPPNGVEKTTPSASSAPQTSPAHARPHPTK